MIRPLPRRAIVACAGLLAALAAGGCGDDLPRGILVPNLRPSVELTAAPVSSADTAWYSYRMHWSGNDPDGQVARFEYAIDPPPEGSGLDTLWIATVKNELQLFFRATNAYYDPKRGWRSNDFHVFVLRAVDNQDAVSAPKSRAFYSYTVAPVVFITSPPPNKFFSRQLAPAVRINWVGRDDDGVFTQKPVQYKYRLFRSGESGFDYQQTLMTPDSLRRQHSRRGFADWDSVSGDTTFARYTLLTPGAQYLFVVIGFDEAGAYSPDFSLESNMLRFTPGFAGTLGPTFTVFNEFFAYSYPSGGVSNDPLAWVNIDVPAGRPVTFNWFAAPPEGANIEWYRWKLDGDTSDETPRTDENRDWSHWSRKSPLTNSCTIGPFGGGEEHFLYIEARDNNGLTSLATVHFPCIAPTFEKDLLVVDDTRLVPDRFVSGAVPQGYSNTAWPSAAELDTFLFARGGFPWRGPHGVTGNLPRSRPGVFAGYSFDTLGTRLGFEFASAGVPLGLLGRYRHVLWYTDITGATSQYGPLSLVDPIATLRWISVPGRLNTLATYLFAGGKAWLAGGTAATCTLLPYIATGSRNNDARYGPGIAPVFSASAGELAPGRILFDSAHWRSEMVAGKPITVPRRSSAAVGGWSHPGWGGATVTAPDYTKLPPVLRKRSLALGDSMPPTRTNPAEFYAPGYSPAVEYLTDDNRIVEDLDPNPLVEDLASTLDTLYELQGGTLATLYTGRRPVTMTYYHGKDGPPFVFSGFDLWTWSRQDVVALVDFVLHDIWGMNRAAPQSLDRPALAAPAAAPGRTAPAGPARGRAVRVPGGRGTPRR